MDQVSVALPQNLRNIYVATLLCSFEIGLVQTQLGFNSLANKPKIKRKIEDKTLNLAADALKHLLCTISDMHITVYPLKQSYSYIINLAVTAILLNVIFI